MRKVTLSLAIALLFAGSAALTADAQTSSGANNIAGAAQNFTPMNRRRAGDGDLIVGLDLSACAAGSDAGVVPAGNGHANGEAPPAASSSRDGGEFDLTRHDRAWVTRRARHGRRIQRAFTA